MEKSFLAGMLHIHVESRRQSINFTAAAAAFDPKLSELNSTWSKYIGGRPIKLVSSAKGLCSFAADNQTGRTPPSIRFTGHDQSKSVTRCPAPKRTSGPEKRIPTCKFRTLDGSLFVTGFIGRGGLSRMVRCMYVLTFWEVYTPWLRRVLARQERGVSGAGDGSTSFGAATSNEQESTEGRRRPAENERDVLP